MKQKKSLSIILVSIYALLNLILLIRAYSEFGLSYEKCKFAYMLPTLKNVLFGVFCVFVALTCYINSSKVIKNDNDEEFGISGVIFGIPALILYICWDTGRKWLVNAFAQILLYFPAYEILWLITEDSKPFWQQNIPNIILKIIVIIVLSVIAFVIDWCLSLVISNPLQFLVLLGESDGNTSTSKNTKDSSSVNIGEVLDAAAEYEARKDLRRSADALEKIHYDLNRK